MKQLFLAAMLCLLAACNSDNVNIEISDKLNLDFTIETITRAPILDEETGEGSFNIGDELGLFFNTNDGKIKDIKYIIGHTTIKWDDILNKHNIIEGWESYQSRNTETADEIIKISGIYPFFNKLDECGCITYNILDNYQDILIARPTEAEVYTEKNIKIMFKHALSRLNIIYFSSDNSVSNEELNSISTICNAKSVCKIDVINGVVDYKSSSNVTKYGTKNGVNPKILIVPQNGEISLEIKVNNINAPIKKIDGLFESGKQLDIKLDVKRKDNGEIGIDLTGTTIGKWENNGTINGEIDL